MAHCANEHKAGFPFFQLDRFLKILVQDLKKNVAISEEFPNDASGRAKSGGLLFDRKVARVVTPGTLVDEKFIDPYENNFLLAISPRAIAGPDPQIPLPTEEGLVTISTHPIGLAWLDLSTGECFTQEATIGSLPSENMRIGAREILLSDDIDESLKQSILNALEHAKNIVTWRPESQSNLRVSDWAPMLETPVSPSKWPEYTEQEVLACSILLRYVEDRLLGLGMKLQAPVKRIGADVMGIDKNSMKGLELLGTSRTAIEGGKGSLLHSMRRTVTRSGTRLLKERISSPSTSLPIINQRLDLVEQLFKDVSLRETVTQLLQRTFDSQRLVQKFSLGRGDADDLVSLHRTIVVTEQIASKIEESISQHHGNGLAQSLSGLLSRLSLEGPMQLTTNIANAVDEDGLMASHHIEEEKSAAVISMSQRVLMQEGSPNELAAMPLPIRSGEPPVVSKEQSGEEDSWIMRESASSTLKRLHRNLRGLRGEMVILTTELRQKTGAPSLTLRWTPGLGHICHIKGVRDVRASMESGSYRNGNSSKSTRSFYIPEWSSLGTKIDQVKLQIRAEEQNVFQKLRIEVVQNLLKLRRNAAVLDELDVACSFATLAHEQGFIRPLLNNSTSHKVVGGRHPTVVLGLSERGRAFVSNDCFVGEQKRIWLITGPNMAGKSTFLRQNALISILAQVGSYVPAEYAEIGIVDQIFSRIGSADDLFQDQSTFMVEMLETANILISATSRSFVIMDEVGRGTTPEDGLAVGYACLHHLYHINKSRTLFATHFHALADMTSGWDHLVRYCTDVSEESAGSFAYLHRLREGVNRESHALKVARLAGVPEAAIKVADQVARDLKSHQQHHIGNAVQQAAA